MPSIRPGSRRASFLPHEAERAAASSSVLPSPGRPWTWGFGVCVCKCVCVCATPAASYRAHRVDLARPETSRTLVASTVTVASSSTPSFHFHRRTARCFTVPDAANGRSGSRVDAASPANGASVMHAHCTGMPADASRVETARLQARPDSLPGRPMVPSVPSLGEAERTSCCFPPPLIGGETTGFNAKSGILTYQGEPPSFPAVYVRAETPMNRVLLLFVCLANPVTTSDLRISTPNCARHALQAPRKRGGSERTHGAQGRVSVRRPPPQAARMCGLRGPLTRVLSHRLRLLQR